jgi:hypothetical protein
MLRIVPDRPMRQWRALILGLTAALVAVLGLDATAIVAAPDKGHTSRAGSVSPADVSPPTGLRTIRWSGQEFLVYPSGQPGPETGVKLTDSKKAVYVDAKGRLHLTIIKVKGGWRSVELVSLSQASYGTYRWVVRGSTASFSRNAVLGLFVYQNTGVKFGNEIDIEDSRFTHFIDPNNAQYVVQPYNAPNHWCTYTSSRSLRLESQQFEWTPGRVRFSSRKGSSPHGALLSPRCSNPGAAKDSSPHTFTYTGSDVPKPSGQRIYIDMWTNKNRPPTHGHHSVILDSFSYAPTG